VYCSRRQVISGGSSPTLSWFHNSWLGFPGHLFDSVIFWYGSHFHCTSTPWQPLQPSASSSQTSVSCYLLFHKQQERTWSGAKYVIGTAVIMLLMLWDREVIAYWFHNRLKRIQSLWWITEKCMLQSVRFLGSLDLHYYYIDFWRS
jgi:hypothetical protein